jgi:hypothetical protein
VLALGLALLVARPRMLGPFAAAAGATVGLVLVLLTLQSGPWPLFYIWELPRRHEISLDLVSRFWDDLLARFSIPLLVAPLFFVARFMSGERRRVWFYAITALGMVGMAWVSRSNIGGAHNVELPAYAILSVTFALGLHEALVHLGSASARARGFRAYIVLAAVIQFAMLVYNPRLTVPYRSDVWAAERLAATLSALPGPVFAGSFTSYVPESAEFVQPEPGAVHEVMGGYGGPGTPEAGQWMADYRAALAEHRFTYVVVDPDLEVFWLADVAREMGYVDQGLVFPASDQFWLWRTRGGWVPKAQILVRPDLVEREIARAP